MEQRPGREEQKERKAFTRQKYIQSFLLAAVWSANIEDSTRYHNTNRSNAHRVN